MSHSLMRALAALVPLSLAGCGTLPSPDHWGAVPTRAMLEVPRPRFAIATTGYGPGDAFAADVDTVVLPALKLVDAVTANTEPELKGDVAEWRTVPGASEAILYRFVVENVSEDWSGSALFGTPVKPAQSWRYRLEAKPKMRGDDAFRVVLSGTRETPEGDVAAELGTGALQVNWREACSFIDWREVCEAAARRQSVDVSFAVDGSTRTVAVELDQVTPVATGEARYTLELHGTVDADNAGELQIVQHYVYPNQAERPASTSRLVWVSSGAGRNDYVHSWAGSTGDGAPISGTARGVTCWGADALTTYSREDSGPAGPQETGDASTCPTGAQVAPLP
ncbi:hypothetical protein F0U61_32465 [Archangium violaceum]|uniref:hypothetical protein n=1 Tax=Archangium violaceum TaxID=83451 RepID=UPI002B31BCB4|nr:hypothetical protein F0U61_32465 [Archangium violaceum]